MKILLINPNTYHSPPVIPLALEYLATAVEVQGHWVDVLDLCFSEDPEQEAKNRLNNQTYGLIGLTIRNVDTVLFNNNEFFLDRIKSLINSFKPFHIPIVLGGCGYSISPEAILEYCGADCGVVGPGENALVHLIRCIETGKGFERIIDGKKHGFDRKLVARRSALIDYPRYIKNGGIIGFETQKGCLHYCSYCVEAGTGVLFKEPESVAEEISQLVARGYHDFHLCDSEFNLNLPHCINFLQALVKKKLGMTWALYMVPTPVNEYLFILLKQSHAQLITFSVASDPREMQQVGYTFQDLETILYWCRERQIKIAIDLIVGFPGESWESIEKMLSFFKENRPDSVGVNFYFRLYKNLQISQTVASLPANLRHYSRSLTESEDYLVPIFYNAVEIQNVQSLIAGDSLFKIEGFEKSVNYQRV